MLPWLCRECVNYSQLENWI